MSDALVLAFPYSLASAVAVVAAQLPTSRLQPAGSITSSCSRTWPDLVIVEDKVRIPVRIYNPEPPARLTARFSRSQQCILACIYSRHHDGFVRQRWLRSLLGSDEEWTVPFIVQSLGEYVIEISSDIERFTRTELPGRPAMRQNVWNFFHRNPEFVTLTEQRANSYWSCYHRRDHPARATYPASAALTALRKVTP